MVFGVSLTRRAGQETKIACLIQLEKLYKLTEQRSRLLLSRLASAIILLDNQFYFCDFGYRKKNCFRY